MITACRTGPESIPAIVVDDRRVPRRWQSIDLAQLQTRLDDHAAAPVRISATLAGPPQVQDQPSGRTDVAAACVVIGARRRRLGVPLDRFVVIGRDATLPQPAAPSANDNAPAAGKRRIRTIVREVVLLAMLAASLAGAFYSGRMHASQNVIVVPAPSSPRNALT